MFTFLPVDGLNSLALILFPMMARVFTFEDVVPHNTKDDLYLIVRGKVYDISPFVDEHP
jgi:cytochrome b involved in lipid metabolism